MVATTSCFYYAAPTTLHKTNHLRQNNNQLRLGLFGDNAETRKQRIGPLMCSNSNESSEEEGGGWGIKDFIGGDLVKFDLGKWLTDVEEHKALAMYTPHEGGYEGRYFTRLRNEGYYFLDLSARGLGDPETTLTKIHPVCPAHLGKQPIARWYFPPEVDFRLSVLPPDAKGLIVWIIEAKVLSKAELQFLALLPELRPKVRVIAECGNWRNVVWRPLKEAAGLTEGALSN
uniref:NADH dehydrogenase-like complex N n=1 Tax=Pelargonium myrrhifolium TaxID=253081 RepID=A0A0F7H015_9ROSI